MFSFPFSFPGVWALGRKTGALCGRSRGDSHRQPPNNLYNFASSVACRVLDIRQKGIGTFAVPTPCAMPLGLCFVSASCSSAKRAYAAPPNGSCKSLIIIVVHFHLPDLLTFSLHSCAKLSTSSELRKSFLNIFFPLLIYPC